MKNFKLKKNLDAEHCDAMRCPETWIRPLNNGTKLCNRHLEMMTPEELAEYTQGQKHDYFPDEPKTDETAVRSEIEPYAASAANTLEQLENFEISDSEEAEQIGIILRQAHEDFKRLEKMRTEVTKPILEAKRGVDGWFKPVTQKLNALKTLLKGKLEAWNDKQITEREKALESGDNEALATTEPELPPGVATRLTWDWKVVNIDLVPREFMTVDEAAIRAAMERLGPENVVIPGIEIVSREKVVMGRK